ncbi:MAG TPA: hypothetical protein VIM30_09375 [Candidatus Limnocylindrales bacterium]|jgi:hypothetical protein
MTLARPKWASAREERDPWIALAKAALAAIARRAGDLADAD